MLPLAAVRTRRLTRALELARDEALDLGAPALGTEHLLLGLVLEGEERVDLLLADVDPHRVRGLLPSRPVGGGSPPMSARAVAAVGAARRAGGDEVDVGHLLAGVLGDPASGAVGVLERLGVDVGDLWVRAVGSVSA